MEMQIRKLRESVDMGLSGSRKRSGQSLSLTVSLGPCLNLLPALGQFNALGVAFVSLSEPIDTTAPARKVVFTLLGAVAELERSLIAERLRSGLRNARVKGKRVGRTVKQR
jgi:Resolvase, N terminal domain